MRMYVGWRVAFAMQEQRQKMNKLMNVCILENLYSSNIVNICVIRGVDAQR